MDLFRWMQFLDSILGGGRKFLYANKIFGGRALFTKQQYKKIKKLNLACSDRILPGWINVDIKQIPGIDYVCDVRNLKIFEDESFDLVRASHILEHFHLFELKDILKEWTRVLKKGGWLVICVPNFDLTVRRYIKAKGIINFANEQKYVELNGQGRRNVLLDIYGKVIKEPGLEHYEHYMVYNRESLSCLMERWGGLQNVRSINYTKEEPFTLGIEDDSADFSSLNLAGQKT